MNSFETYNKAKEIVHDIQTGRIHRSEVLLMVLKLAELHPDTLIEMKNSIRGIKETVIEFLQAGQKIWAIKFYRDAAGVGLREAKDVVDEIDRKLMEV